MLRVLSFFLVTLPFLSSAQEDTTSVTFASVFALRCPDRQNIDSMIAALKLIPGIKLNTDCFRKADDMVALYRAEDLRQWKKLKNQATSYRSGWREKNPGRCNAGGPPPICPIDHWYRAGVAAAMNEFHAVHREIYLRRQNQIWLAFQNCVVGRPLKVQTFENDNGVREKTYEPTEFKVSIQN